MKDWCGIDGRFFCCDTKEPLIQIQKYPYVSGYQDRWGARCIWMLPELAELDDWLLA